MTDPETNNISIKIDKPFEEQVRELYQTIRSSTGFTGAFDNEQDITHYFSQIKIEPIIEDGRAVGVQAEYLVRGTGPANPKEKPVSGPAPPGTQYDW